MAKDSSSSSKMISMKTNDDVIFKVESDIANEMKAIKDFFDETVTPLHNVSSHSMKVIIEYLKQHRLGDTEDFNTKFLKPLSHDKLKELLLAANCLNIESLRSLVCQFIADMIENKSVEFVREFLNIDNDYTQEEEAAVRAEVAWAFEDVDKDEK